MTYQSIDILCNAYSLPSPVLCAGDVGLHKIGKVPILMGLILQQGEMGNKNTSSHFKEVFGGT